MVTNQSKLKTLIIQGLAHCKDKSSFGYWFYISKTRKIIFTINYYMALFTTNNSSYTSRNYETIIDLYNKGLEKKTGENKDTDFTVDEGFNLNNIKKMPLDKFLLDLTEAKTLENIDKSMTINYHDSFFIYMMMNSRKKK